MDKSLEWKYGRKFFKNNKEKRDIWFLIALFVPLFVLMFIVALWGVFNG